MKTLQQIVAECTEEQLEKIAQLWGLGSPPDGEWIHHREQLAQGMLAPIAARFVWEALSQDEREVLYGIFRYHLANWTEPQILSSITHLPQSRYEAALNKLKQYLLVLEEQTSTDNKQLISAHVYSFRRPDLPAKKITILYMPQELANLLCNTGNEFFSSQYDRSTMPLETILSKLSPTELQEIGRHYEMDLKSKTYNANLAPLLAKKLLKPEAPFFALRQLEPETRDLFTWVCEKGGKVSMREVRTHTGYNDAALSVALHTLEQYALAFDTFSMHQRVLFVPYDIYSNWRKATTRPEDLAKLTSLESPPQSVLPGGTIALYDLAALIGSAYQQNIEPTKTGMASKRVASKLQSLLQGRPRYIYSSASPEAENHYVDMLLYEANELGLLQFSQPAISGAKEHLEPGPQLQHWSQMNAAEQTQFLLQHWLKSTTWADVSGANYIPEAFYYFNIVPGRSAILSYLRECAPGRWYSLSSLLRRIREENPFALRSPERTLGRPGDRRTAEVMAKWEYSDGQKFIGMLSSSLYELGIVALGYQRPTVPEVDEAVNPDAFMLTELGAAVLSSQASEVQSSSRVPGDPASNGNKPLVVQPNFELLLMQPDLPTLYSLFPFAQIEQVGIVSRLTLTRQSVLRAIDAGKDIEQILQFLEERSQKGVPQNVEYTLRDWARLYKKVTISQVLLLEVSSEELANEICTSSKLKAFGLRRLGSCVVAASSDANPQELRRTLDKMGIAAHISGDILTPQKR